MTATVSVSEVLAHLRRAVLEERSEGHGEPAASTHLLGRLFHAAAADATGADEARNVFCLMEDLAASREETGAAVRGHLYDQILGPRLYAQQDRLQSVSAQVVTLWSAAQTFADWLVGLAWESAPFDQDDPRAAWADLRATLKAEVPVEATLSDERWSEPVRLTGIADLLLRAPATRRWCAVELKTGQVPDELALLQACLYHLAIEAEAPADGASALAIARFGDDVAEALFEGHRVREVRERLVELIGAMTGVGRQPAQPISVGLGVGKVGTSGPVRVPAAQDPFCQQLERAYRDLGLGVSVTGQVEVGPTFRRYQLALARGTAWGKVKKSLDDLEIRLATRSPMTLQREIGRIYLNVQREDRQVISYLEVPLPKPQPDRAELLAGVDISGRPVMLDLANDTTPHVLVSGTTGSGKSEWLVMALTSLAASRSPEELKLVLIDPKRTAFMSLSASPYLWGDAGLVLPPDHDPIDVLDKLIDEMERRFGAFGAAGARDLREYAAQGHAAPAPPRIVVACDEFMDLMLGSSQRKAVESRIARLGAKARAAGIHLILATQQPRRDVVTGIIQANLPARIALRAESPIEAAITRCPGAERLLGKGDLLFRSLGEPKRLQAPLVAPETRDQILLRGSGARPSAARPFESMA